MNTDNIDESLVQSIQTNEVVSNYNSDELVVRNHSRANESNSKTTERKRNVIKNDSTNHTNDGKGLIIAGVMFLVLGLIVLWYLSIAGGLAMAIGGLIMMIAGNTKFKKANNLGNSGKKNSSNSNDGEWQDVVYLKNGGIIRGMIIEQVPNVTLKIQTRDGSVFVYKFEEISKITKEKSIN